MTGFARQSAEFAWGSAAWEVRSVNHRYLELGIRLPEPLRHIESLLRAEIPRYTKRGKIELSLKLQVAEQAEGALQFNEAMISSMLAIYQKYSAAMPTATFDFARLLTWPGVHISRDTDLTFVQADIMQLFTQTMMQFKQAKQREGKSIADFISERLVAIEQQVQLAATYLPEFVQQARAKLTNRLAELQQAVDPVRLEQEMVIIAQRLDVAEELDRLQQHLKQVSELIIREEEVGRRLDFLMQELNREANTLGSKANDIRLTQIAVEIKVLIEQMREQIQNVE